MMLCCARRQLQSSSPDDVAIVGGVGTHGFVFEGRSAAYINTTESGSAKRFELLHTLEFSSARKRMSVIVRTDAGELLLYCKGADSVIKERLTSNDPMLEVTWGHLEEYAVTGLRTLLVAKRVLRPELYAEWSKQFNAACCALEAREAKIEAASDAIERELHILGATAIEDKLQDGCAETIAILREAEVKIWMLTGDKQETAINIAKSCNLVTSGMEILILNSSSKEAAASRLDELVLALPSKRVDLTRKSSLAEHEHRVLIDIEEGTMKMKPAVASPNEPANPRQPPVPPSPVFIDDQRDWETASADVSISPPQEKVPTRSLVVDGGTLLFILEDDSALKKPFLQLISQCASVVACRMSPLQKAQVVKLVRDNTEVITLAIGDGANDVSMITTAHIGVGISGQEGLQAMLASDYAISQFRHLQPLLLVHGRWSYRRIAELIVYSFYKNFTFVLGNVWFSFLTGFSGKLFYDDLLDGAYNMFFTGLPIVCYACMEQDVPAEVSLRTPKLYLEGLARHRFNFKVALRWVLNGFAHSIGIFVCTLWLVQTGGEFVISEWDIGETMMALVITTVTLRLLLECRYITVIHALILPLSVVMWFVLSQTRSQLEFPDDTFVGVVPRLYRPFFWLGVVIVPMICLLRDFVFKFVKHNYNPRLTHITKRQALKEERKMERLSKLPETVRLNSELE
jgi:phospholipid-transporting ATPase